MNRLKLMLVIVLASAGMGTLSTPALAVSKEVLAKRTVAVSVLANRAVRRRCLSQQMQGLEFSQIQAYECKYPLAGCLPFFEATVFVCRGKYELWVTHAGRTEPVPYQDQKCKVWSVYRYNANGQLMNRFPDDHWGCKPHRRTD